MDHLYLPTTPVEEASNLNYLDRSSPDLIHFNGVVVKLARAVPSLESVLWEFDELLNIKWLVERRGAEGEVVVVDGFLDCHELDDLASRGMSGTTRGARRGDASERMWVE